MRPKKYAYVFLREKNFLFYFLHSRRKVRATKRKDSNAKGDMDIILCWTILTYKVVCREFIMIKIIALKTFKDSYYFALI
jgi:hypothetical protein